MEFGGVIGGGKFTAMRPLKYRATFPSVKSKTSPAAVEK
jgi:hypothetical protein